MLRRLSLFFLVSASLSLAACSNGDDGKPDAQNPPADAGDQADAGEDPVDAGDGKCRSDLHCPDNQYCELSSGECLDAKPCTRLSDCDYQKPGAPDYCDFGGCFCDLDRNGGTCRPRFALCNECERDIECGDDYFVYQDYTATCRDLGGSKVCLPTTDTTCPPAYVMSQDGTYCEPVGGSCSDVPACARDSDCDPMSENPVCDVDRGFCVPACVFDYPTAKSDCAPGLVCHVDPRLLTANNPNFGGGKCGLPCDSGSNPFTCATGTSCEPDGDALFVSELPTRCRPEAPKCIRNADCPQSPETHSNGYCERGTLNCSTGCQRESDCIGGYKCVENQCVEKTCVENGGANLACVTGQLCCGEAGGVDPCPTGVSYGKCYTAPTPPWCTMEAGECSTVGVDLANTPGGPRPQPSQCVQVTGSKVRGDAKLVFHACDPAAGKAACPARWECLSIAQFCSTDADCGAGGKCNVDLDMGDYGKVKACGCSGGESCPSPSTCGQDDEGNPTFCEASWCDNLKQCLEPPKEEPAP